MQRFLWDCISVSDWPEHTETTMFLKTWTDVWFKARCTSLSVSNLCVRVWWCEHGVKNRTHAHTNVCVSIVLEVLEFFLQLDEQIARRVLLTWQEWAVMKADVLTCTVNTFSVRHICGIRGHVVVLCSLESVNALGEQWVRALHVVGGRNDCGINDVIEGNIWEKGMFKWRSPVGGEGCYSQVCWVNSCYSNKPKKWW